MKQYLKKAYLFVRLVLVKAQELLILSNQKHLASNLMRIIRFRDPVFALLNRDTFTEKTLVKIQSLLQEKQQPAILEKDLLAGGLNSAEDFFKPLNKFGISLNGKIGMDVGCGRGAACIYAVNAGMSEVTGIDTYKANFLNFPNKNTILENVLKRVNLLEMDIVNSNFGRFEKSFDIIWSKASFEHISDPQKALSNIAFMLKPGGHFLADMGPLFNCVGGSHQDDVVGIPYHQHIFDDKTVYNYLEKSGKLKHVHTIIFPNTRDPYPDVNRLPFSYYKNLFIEESPEFALLRFSSRQRSLRNIHLYRFFNKDSSKLSLRELVMTSIVVLMQKI